MKKFVFLFSIISFCILSGFIVPDVVFASEQVTVNGSNSGYNALSISFSLPSDSKYCFGFASGSDMLYVYVEEFSGEIEFNYTTSDGVYSSIAFPQSLSPYNISCYQMYFINKPIFSSAPVVVDGIYPFGNDAFDLVDSYFSSLNNGGIADSDLDISGLSAYILNDQTGSVDWEQTCKNLMMNFYSSVLETFFDINKSMEESIVDPGLLQGSIVNYVPGVALAWNSPPLDPDISYSVWVDGISKINYKTSIDPISNYLNTQQISSCGYSKLQINDSPLVQSGSVYYQYNTNQGLQTILEFIENNSSLNPPSNVHSWSRYSYVNLETTISRVYIQAYKEVDGERHYGALSYVDIVDGQPIVHEGVTDDISDIIPSDPGTTGTTTTTGVPMTTSGNTIYTGDTITNNNEYNYNYGTGLIVGTSNPLGFIKRLFSAIFELIQSLYLAFLVPFILLGMTGSTGGIL